MINYFYDSYTILNKVYSDKTFLKQAISSTIIEEKNRSLTIKTVYGVLDKDIELSYYISALTDKTPKLAIRTILKISMYAINYLNKAPYAVIDNAVELTKKLGKKGASGFVNAFLRKFSTIKIELPKDKISYLSVKYSYPEFAVKNLIKDYGEDVAKSIMSFENEGSYLSFFNADGEEYLLNRKVNYTKTVFDNLFYVKNFTMDDGFYNGVYTYQNIGSYAICDITPSGDKLLDVCAAPGGKSINLSRKFNQVISYDVHPHRVELIKQYANRMKVENVTAFTGDSTVFIPEYENAFDVVLCDSPCSGFGVVHENPDMKLNREYDDVKNINALQLSILKNVCRYVKKGGYLVYSTCSVFSCENQAIIDKFLLENKDFCVEDINSKLANIKVKNGLQFLPHFSGGGFFVCKLKKI